MIWTAWRQHRLQLLSAAGTLSILGAMLLITGVGIFSVFRASGLAHCLATPGADCNALAGPFLSRYSNLQFVVPLFLLLPALAGLFLGAPLIAREVEQGTHRLAWTQGVTRARWLGVKLAVLAAGTVAGAAILSWGVSWWSRPFVLASDDRFIPGIFDVRGLVPIGYALFALALGVAAGALTRRTVPAMAGTVAVFATVRAAVELWVRPHYMAARTLSFPVFGRVPHAGRADWILSRTSVDSAGHLLGAGGGLDLNRLSTVCPELLPRNGAFPDKGPMIACLQKIGARTIAVYQPGGRYWAFQAIEAGIFIAMAIGLVALSFWWVKRRVV
jgi:hypothetical protein